MRALVTGGAGFVGSHLAEHLLAAGWSVHVLDDLSTGAIDNLATLRGTRGFSYTIGTVYDRPLVAELVDAADVVFHLAAAVGVQLVVSEPVRTIETNVHGTEVVLECAAKKHKKVMIASTSEVYGKSDRIPFAEDDDLVLGPTTRSRWAYACSKALDEFLALAYHREKGLPATIVRLFNTVGPRQTGRYGMVIPRFVRQALDGGPVTVHGDGSQSRTFCHVADVVGALRLLASRDDVAGEVFNVGSDVEVTIAELAERVVAAAGTGAAIVKIPYDEAYAPGFEDMRRRLPNIARIRARIGFEPTRDLDAIIADVIEYERRTRT